VLLFLFLESCLFGAHFELIEFPVFSKMFEESDDEIQAHVGLIEDLKVIHARNTTREDL
jgi:hypothetical protein